MLTDHLADMRRFMPTEHHALIEHVEALPDLKEKVVREPFNDAADGRRVVMQPKGPIS